MSRRRLRRRVWRKSIDVRHSWRRPSAIKRWLRRRPLRPPSVWSPRARRRSLCSTRARSSSSSVSTTRRMRSIVKRSPPTRTISRQRPHWARSERYGKAKATGLAAIKANDRERALIALGDARSIHSARFLAEGLDKAIGDNTPGSRRAASGADTLGTGANTVGTEATTDRRRVRDRSGPGGTCEGAIHRDQQVARSQYGPAGLAQRWRRRLRQQRISDVPSSTTWCSSQPPGIRRLSIAFGCA